jgi:hypothetical protein
MCWHIVETGEEGCLWIGGDPAVLPPQFTEQDLAIAHYALAELGCYEALGWMMPPRVIDTISEVRIVRGQIRPAGGWSLLGVASAYGISAMSAEHKSEMRDVAMQEVVPEHLRADLMSYCQSDCRVLADLWRRIGPNVDLPRAELRGRYLKALARVEGRGIPADQQLVGRLEEDWTEIQSRFRDAARERYPGVYTEEGAFSSKQWLQWCAESGVPWPVHPSGAPMLDDDTFRRVAPRFPAVQFMRDTRRTLSQTRAVEFPLGHDGRLRCMLSPFSSATGRNQPGTSKYVFGQPSWLRRIIQAPAGRVLAYIDYSSQEFALAAALSGDDAMTADYDSGDPYIALAVRAGAVSAGATKTSHPHERAAFKVTALAVQYGMQALSLAASLGFGRGRAAELIASHRTSYPQFWTWRQAVIDHLLTGGDYETIFGWRRVAGQDARSTSLANFPVQASGAEILRLAIIALEENGHRVVAPVHDAVLVEMDEDGYVEELAKIRTLMERAGRVVTGGLGIRSDADLVMPGEHFEDPRGAEMWEALGPDF